jgi:hypothetical protein
MRGDAVLPVGRDGLRHGDIEGARRADARPAAPHAVLGSCGPPLPGPGRRAQRGRTGTLALPAAPRYRQLRGIGSRICRSDARADGDRAAQRVVDRVAGPRGRPCAARRGSGPACAHGRPAGNSMTSDSSSGPRARPGCPRQQERWSSVSYRLSSLHRTVDPTERARRRRCAAANSTVITDIAQLRAQ